MCGRRNIYAILLHSWHIIFPRSLCGGHTWYIIFGSRVTGTSSIVSMILHPINLVMGKTHTPPLRDHCHRNIITAIITSATSQRESSEDKGLGKYHCEHSLSSPRCQLAPHPSLDLLNNVGSALRRPSTHSYHHFSSVAPLTLGRRIHLGLPLSPNPVTLPCTP